MQRVFIYLYWRSTCFRRFLRPSSGAHNCTYSFRYCQPILLLAAFMDEIHPPPIIRSTLLYIQLQVLSNNTAACCYHGWDPSSGHHQEHITVHTALGIVNQYCCWLLSWVRWNWRSISSMIAASSSIVWQYLKLYVQLCALDDGRGNRLKHVQRL